MVEATERLADRGIEVAGLQPRTLFPVLDETVEFVRSRPMTYVVEHNHEGQLIEILAAAGAPLDRMTGVRRTDGLVFTPGEIVDRVAQEVSR
jgi:pyruvate/2-oxoacid:ferredoxin oxidoreductase alpha subunit